MITMIESELVQYPEGDIQFRLFTLIRSMSQIAADDLKQTGSESERDTV